MKLATFLVLSCLVISTFTTLTTFEQLNKIAQDEFGKTLLDTIQLELTSSNKADPRPRILKLLQEIKDEALSALSDLNTQHSNKQEQCQTDQNNLQDQIDNLISKINEANAEISSSSQTLTAITGQRDVQQNLIDSNVAYLAEITNTRNQEQADFEYQDNKIGQLLAILEKTKQFIVDRLVARQGEIEAAPSFLEKENILIEVKNTVMSAEFQTISPGWGQLVSFLATKAMNKLKQEPEDVAATAGLQSIVDLINQLIAQINQSRNELRNANELAEQNFQTQKNGLESAISDATAAVSALEIQISGLNSRIDQLKSDVADFNRRLEDLKNQLANSKQDCSDYEDQYTKTSAARQKELDLIDQVISIVNNQLTGLREYTENNIKNSAIVVDA